jgi:rod shape determining protein RodA
MIYRISLSSTILYFLTGLLLCCGWIILCSAANGNADEWANKQLYTALITLILSFFAAFIPTRYFFKISYYILILCIALLIAAEFTGHTAMGAQRWLKIGSITIQPSEVSKIGVILALARCLSQLSLEQISRIRNLIIPLFIVFIPVCIILRQPNLGTSTIIILISGAIFFVSGVRIWKFVLVIIGCVISMPLIWNFLHDYQKRRLMTFLNPETDILGAGYNIMQSKIAIGSGGLYGKGFMHGTQVQLSFLPEKHTDFVFTILAEEFGFYGVICVLLLYLLLVFMIYFIAFRIQNSYGKMVCIGIASMFFFHVSINIGMISGLLPVVGTPLPLMSYGRSNLVTMIIAIALVFNADIYRNQNQSKLLQ